MAFKGETEVTESNGDRDKMSRAIGKLLPRVLMVPPKYFKVEYNINPWMGGVVDQPKAQRQWDDLRKAIEKAGVPVQTLEPVDGLPDMVFVCNSGIVHNNKVFQSKFRHKERQGEEQHYIKWFKENGFDIQGADSKLCFEGGGDACFSTPDTLWAGFGPRTDKAVYEQIAKLGKFDTVLCELALPNFYHLDTCFCPVDETTALWYPPAFSEKTRKEMSARLPHLIAISDAEANAFVCNAITIRSTVISPIGIAKETVNKLSDRGFNVVECDMSEFMKAGGACQCLVLKL
uniref:Amidinotransferase n=1 Tax=Plectus sambesii TaxID=2011161 RepID=A0A914WZZ0_9BILA